LFNFVIAGNLFDQYFKGGSMPQQVLKEIASLKDYWLEPASNEVEPVELSVTDGAGKAVEVVPYSERSGLELEASACNRSGVLVDFGKEVGGFPKLRFGAGSCRRVGVQLAESNKHLVNPALAAGFSKVDPTVQYGHVKAKPDSETTLRHFGGFRYMLLFPERPGKVALSDVRVEYTPHRVDDPDTCGYFLCSDEQLNRAWFAGLHTLEMCTVHPDHGGYENDQRIGRGDWVLIDGAKRDRLIWTGDLDVMLAGVAVGTFNMDAVKDSLYSLAEHQHSSGYIPACSPGSMPIGLASGMFGDYVAWWIVVLYKYYLHTGDIETVRDLFPVLKGGLDYLHSQCKGGLYRQTTFNMLEWCFTVLRRGKPSYTNIVYYWALNCASSLAHAIDEEEKSVGFVSRAFRLGEAIERELWDEGREVFFDTSTDRKRVPQDANSLAIVSGLASEPLRQQLMLSYMREHMWEQWGSTNVDVPYYRLTPGLPFHNKRVVPFMNYYEALARFIARDDEGALELMRRCWGTIVDSEPGSTFWEWAGRKGGVDVHFASLCHGWSAGIVPLLSKYVLGVRPVAPAYSRYLFDARPSDLEWAEGRIPVPGGFIEARFEKSGKGLERR